MNLILWDQKEIWQHLLPFSFTRPCSHLRAGITTIAEKHEALLGQKPSYLLPEYLSAKYPLHTDTLNLLVAGHVVPDAAFAEACRGLEEGHAIVHNGRAVAAVVSEEQVLALQHEETMPKLEERQYRGSLLAIERPWHLFQYCGELIQQDFERLKKGRSSQPIPEGVYYLNREGIFIEEGAQITFSSLNAKSGPIYIGRDAEIMEGCTVRGPFALGPHSQLKMGAKIYGPTSIGPECRVGGEVNNSVFQGYSNKGHDGFVGNAVIGEWCNLGADTNNSNLKNNYEEVRVWSYATSGFARTGLQFCGLFMGDHSKCGINTMFNTGTVVGVSANVFGAGFPRNFIPSFSWGGAGGFTHYKFEKAMQTARLVMARRNVELAPEDEALLRHVYDQTEKYRIY